MNYLILGNGDYARMVFRYLKNTKSIQVAAYTVDKELISESVLDGITVISTDEILERFDPQTTKIFMGIGYRNMNQIKEREYIRYKKMGFNFENFIHPTAIIENDVVLGEGNNIFEGVIIQEGVTIGNANLIYGGALIAHENRIGNYNSFSVKSCVAGCSVVRNNCFIGANATIRDHIILENYTLVGAGTYVDSSTCEYEVIAAQKSIILDGRKSVEFI